MGCTGSKHGPGHSPQRNGEAWRRGQGGDQAGTHPGDAQPPPGRRRKAQGAAALVRSSSSSSASSESRSASEWDRLSARDSSIGGIRQQQQQQQQQQQAGLGVWARQGSLLGITAPRPLAPVRDTAQLRLCKVAGCTFVNQYLVIKYLGRGSCGRVFLCMDIDDRRLYAVKIVKKGELEGKAGAAGARRRSPLEDLRREIAIMRRLAHPNVVALREVVDDAASNKMLLVMDYLEGGPVMTREGLERGHRIPEPVARLYFRHMLRALDYLHAGGVVHGDLKPENALMSGLGRVALSDFGCSKVLSHEDELLDRCNGTPAFLAPEMMRPNARFRGGPADVYALGACLYTFVYGRIPFSAPTVMKLFEVVQSTPVTFPDSPVASPSLKELLLGMLAKDPTQRSTLEAVMQHPWVTLDNQFPLAPSRRRLQRQQEQGQQQQTEQREEGGQRAGAGEAEIDEVAGEATQVNGAVPAGQALLLPPEGQQEQQQEAQQDGERPLGAAGGEGGCKQEGQEEEECDTLGQEDQLRGMVGPGLEVARFRPGEHLLRQGERGFHLLYILEGECEVRYTPSHATPTSTPTTTPASTPAATPARGAGTLADPRSLQRVQSAPAEAQPQVSPVGAVPGHPLLNGSSSSSKPPPGPPHRRSLSFVAASEEKQQPPSGAQRTATRGVAGEAQRPPRRHSMPGVPSPASAAAAAAGGAILLDNQPSLTSEYSFQAGEGAPGGRGLEACFSHAASMVTSSTIPQLGDTGASGSSSVQVVSFEAEGEAGADEAAASPSLPPPPAAGQAAAAGEEVAAAETTAGDSAAAAAPPAAGPAAEALSDPPEAAAAPGGGPAFNFAAPGSSSRLQLRVGIPGEDEAQPATPSFAMASPAARPAAAPGQAPVGGAPASPAGSAAASCSGEGGLQTPRDASRPPAASPSQAGTPPAQRCPSPATPAAAAPALLSPGPLVRPLGPADIDNAYSSVATPEKGPEAGPDVVGEELPPTLIEAAVRAQRLVGELRRGENEYAVGVRGPGQVLGEMEMLSGAGARRVASVVATTRVRAAVVPLAAAKQYLSTHTLAKQQLAELMWVRQSENILMEALARLAAVGEELERLLAQGGGAPPAASPLHTLPAQL